jgi:3-oxoacyl-[acyl-carrier protein] reductase
MRWTGSLDIAPNGTPAAHRGRRRGGPSTSVARVSRHVLVTGGNRGIGLAVAGTLARRGFDVTAATRSGTLPDSAVPDGTAVRAVACDVTDPAAVDAAFAAAEAAAGPVEVLVANAGVVRDQLLMRMSEEDFAVVVDTNLAGAWRCARRAATGMIRRRWGRMIFIGSVVGLYGSPGQTNYAATKAGLVGLARSVTRELGGRGITANVVAPGFVDSDMTAQLDEARRGQYLAAVPVGRFGTGADVAAAVAFLASDEAGYVSGAVLPVDGGLGMGH